MEQQSRKAQVSLEEIKLNCWLTLTERLLTYLFNLNIVVETLVELFGVMYFLRSAKADIIAIFN